MKKYCQVIERFTLIETGARELSIFLGSGYNYSEETSLHRTPSGPQNSYRKCPLHTQTFFPDWLILLQKPALGCLDIVKSTLKFFKRPVFGEERT